MECTASWQPAGVDQRTADLTDLYVSTFQALAFALDAKYRLTNGHVIRVQHNAVRLAREIGIVDPALLKAIDGAALLHDLGKLGIPDHLLNKPARSVRNSDPSLDFHAQGLDAGPLAAGSTLAVPVDTDGAVADVLTLYTRGRDRFSQADAQLVSRLVRNAAAWHAADSASFDRIRSTQATVEEAAAP